MCRVFPKRFVLPLNVYNNTPCGQNLNTRLNSTQQLLKQTRTRFMWLTLLISLYIIKCLTIRRSLHYHLNRCSAHMKIFMVKISMYMEVLNSHTSTIQSTTPGPTATTMDVASDTWLEIRSLKWTFKTSK